MATILNGLVVYIGSSAADNATGYQVVDDLTPYVRWELPPGYQQRKFNVRISNVEPGGWAFTQSGRHDTNETFYQFSEGVELNDNFSGLCKVEILLSQNTGQDFEHINAPFYFVFDRNLERLFKANATGFTWQSPLDPDNLPADVTPRFHLQVCESPLFDVTPSYESDAVYATQGSLVTHEPPQSLFDPVEDKPYFYRVRMFDGLDWGPWSKVNGFVSFSNRPPEMSITGTFHTGNEFGDIIIYFTVSDPDSPLLNVDIAYFGANSEGLQVPLSLLGPATALRPGSYSVVWRSRRQLGNLKWNDVVLYATAYDGDRRSTEVYFGPLVIDNSYIEDEGGGFGATVYNYPVNLGRMAVIDIDENDYRPVVPVQGYAIPSTPLKLQEFKPVAMGPYAWHQIYAVSPLEKRPSSESRAGWTHEPQVGLKGLPMPIAQVNWDNGGTWGQWYADRDGAFKTYIEVTQQQFIFATPYDVGRATTLPEPMASRDLARSMYLWGYIDEQGVEREYPDGYDWDNRPHWHIGREVWRTGDAWIQVGHVEYSETKACETCEGRHWIPQGPAPYRRVPCPNPNCLNGKDITQPNEGPEGNPPRPPKVKTYVRAEWYRLSTWMHGRPFGPEERYGWRVGPYLGPPIKKHFIWGKHISSLEVISRVDNPDGTQTTTVLTHQPYYDRRMTAGVEWAAPSDTTILDRDWYGGVNVDGFLKVKMTLAQGTASDYGPVKGTIHTKSAADKVTAPAAGNIAPGATTYYMGGVPEASHPLHTERAFYPTTPYGIRVTGEFGRAWTTQPLGFVFIQPYWDAYNTIHWRMTGSETSQIHLQFSQANVDGTFTQWADVQGDNARYDPALAAWLVDPLVFHTYWNTANQMLFVEGKDYRLRIRQYDRKTQRFSEWVFSPRFTILHGVANPVSVLSAEYEPFSKVVTIKLRCDDTQRDHYHLIKYWYSTDNGFTWKEINKGDVFGEQSYLSSDPTNGLNIHTIYWNTGGYSIKPSDDVRIKIESLPSDLVETAVLPFLKWFTPNNPYLDEARSELDELLGRMERYVYDPEAKKFKYQDPPTYNPGMLALYQREYEQIRAHPPRIPGPSGVYAFLDQDGNVVDPPGYSGWLAEKYTSAETHAQAMRRVARELDTITRVRIPAAQQSLSYRENEIRRMLIDQGYYAEEHFKGTAPNIREVVDAIPVSNATGEEELPETVERWWRFQVQKSAEGGERLLDDGGYFAPKEVTELEQVFYKVHLDRTATFNSQTFGKPLREFLFNERGERLSVSAFYGGDHNTPDNEGVTDPQGSGAGAGGGQGTNDEGGGVPTDDAPIVNIGGVLKIRPSDLPGQRSGDQMVTGQEEWDGSYVWRVAAYNAFTGPIKAKARARIVGVSLNPSINSVVVDYVARAHERISKISLNHWTDWWWGLQVNGYSVSRQTKVPTWEDVSALNWVSDRRAPNTEPSKNTVPWTPPGKDRPHPWCFYDEDRQQYVLWFTKNGFTQELVGGTLQTVRYRPVQARMMSYPDACEYSSYFENNGPKLLTKPCVIRVGDTYWMFLTQIQQAGQAGNVAITTSTDLHAWAPLVVQNGASPGINPVVVHHGGLFHMWYERLDGGKVKIFYATSDDGYTWSMQNGGSAVYEDLGDVTSPNVVRMNDSWVMYFNDGDTIASVFSADGVTWGGKATELSTTVANVEGANHTVRPCHPCVYQDWYQGNLEWFMAFNYKLEDDTHRIFVARLEGRVWIAGQTNRIHGAAGHLVDVPCSRAGVDRQLTIEMSAHGIQAGDQVKVRLDFNKIDPETTEYHRQSAWVDMSNMSETGSVLEPVPYQFNTQIINYPYMRF